MQAFGCRAEIFTKVFQRTYHRVGGETAERAQRTELHGVAEVFDHGEIFGYALATTDLIDGLNTTRGTDPARCTLAAGFDGAELHREASLLGHVDAVIEHDYT